MVFLSVCTSNFPSHVIFLLPEEHSLVFLTVHICGEQILSAFVHLKFFLMNIFTRYRILDRQGFFLFSFSTLKMFSSLLPYIVSDKKSVVILIFVLLY